MPKRHANSDSESEEEDFSEYSDEDNESEEAESDAEPDEADLVAHKPRKPQRPVAYEVPEEGHSGQEEEKDGDRGLSESEGAVSEKAASSGEHPEDAGREDVQGLGFEVVQNRVSAEGGDGPVEDPVLNEAVEEVKESGSDDGEVLGEIVECGEGEAPARPRAPPQKKKVLTKREYPSDSDVSMPDSPKAAPLPKALNGRSMKIETIDPEDDEESEDEEGDDPNDEEFQPDSPVKKLGRRGIKDEDSEDESQDEEDEDSFIESESDDDTRRRSQKRASTSKKAPQKRGRLRNVGKSCGESSDDDRTRESIRRSTRAGSAQARRGIYKEDSEEEEWEESEEEYVEKKAKKSKGSGKGRKPKKVRNEEDFIVDDEEETSPDASEASDEESDEDFTMGRRGAPPRKSSKAQRRGRSARSEPSPSDDEESDEDFGTRRKGGKSKGRSRASGGGGTARATRSRAGRVEPKSYYEGGDSEDEEYAAAPAAVEEEEDGEAIESVWSHQPVGTAEKKRAAGEDTAPKAEAGSRRATVDWDRVEFYVKWKGRSYIHNTWESLATLEGLPGFKRVGNYMKRIEQELARRGAVSPEEAELMDVQKEMDLEMLEQYTQVDRIIAEGVTMGEDGEEVQQYFVKWQGLAYEEATWENVNDIAFAQDKIDEFKTREANSSIRGKTVDEARRALEGSKDRFLSLAEQPEWLKGGGKLRDYQLEGLNRLIYSWGRDINIILADEMGLGKTLQSVSMLGYLQNEQQIQGPFLVVVPLSVVTNWVKEFRKWVPDMNIVVYVGNRASRDLIMSYEFWTGRKSGRLVKFNTLITTYEIVMKDKTKLSQIKWSYLMVDEAHRLKNHEAALYTSLMEFSSKNKLLITGTPLQNNIEELWALLHFLDPRKFPFENREAFIVRYNALQDVKDVAELHEELRPHLLRRVIKDVEKSLPPKYERILRVGMSPLQKQYYKWILERNFQDLNRGAKGGGQLSLLNVVVELKKCCNHPFLFESAEHGYAGDSGDRTRVQRLVLSSGKLVLLDKLLTRLKETGHRVLIFSQMVRMLDILGEYLSLKGYKSQRLDGSTRADLRHQAMEHFNAPGSEDFCFLLSTRAGGLGVNLATADTVIIFDSDWNPQNDLQAMSRAHRIGQQDVVNIYRFVTSSSVEEDILERARQKMILDHLVIQKMNASGQLYLDNKGRQGNKAGKMFKEDDLKAILRFGAEDLFKESGEESEKKLENMDIDEILARAEKVDAVAAAGAEEGSDDLMGTFKVANFTSNEDDSTFWSRLIQPVAEEEQAGLGQRAARERPVKTYMEEQMEETDKKARPKDRKRDKPRSRGTPLKKAAREESVPEAAPIEGAHARVSEWGGGRGLSKKDAAAFVKAVKKFGDESRMDLIAEEAGGAVDNAEPHDQADLYRALFRGCKAAVAAEEDGEERAKGGPVLDFFGVPVKAAEVLSRIKELTLLAKSVRRFNDPPSQYRLKSHPKNPQWHKTCGWTQVDDAHLLLGVHFHGFGNWEKMRTDERLGLDHKIAAAGLSAHETTLPRAVHLDARAAKLLKEEREHIEGPSKAMKGPLLLRKPAGGGVQRGRKEGGKRERDEEEEGEVGREEGEISGGEEKRKAKKRRRVEDSRGVKGKRKEGGRREERPAKKERGVGGDKEARKDLERARKDEKWRRWCAEEMSEMQPTLDKLQGLQDRDDLSKKETIAKVKKYLKTVGEHIDMVIDDHPAQDPERLAGRLWAYTATFSSMEGTKLADVYQKLKAQKKSPEEPPPPPSHRWPPQEKATHARPASGERFPQGGPSRRPDREEHGGRGRPVSRDQPRVHSPNILLVERPPSRELLVVDGVRPPSRDRLPLDRGVPARGDYYPPERGAPYLDPHDRPFAGGRGAPPAYPAERPRYPVRGDAGYDVRLEYPAEPLVARHRASPNVLPEMLPVGRGPVPEMEPPQEAYRWRERGAPEPGYLGPLEVPPGGPGWRGGEYEGAPRWGGQARRWREEPESVPGLPHPGRWGRVEPGYSARERQMWPNEYPPREEWARGGGPGRGYGGRGFEPQERISPRGMPDGVREPLWDGPPRPGRTAGSYGEDGPGRRWEAVAAPLSVDKKVIVEERTDPTNFAGT